MPLMNVGIYETCNGQYLKPSEVGLASNTEMARQLAHFSSANVKTISPQLRTDGTLKAYVSDLYNAIPGCVERNIAGKTD